MSRKVSNFNIREMSLQGVDNAFKKYHKWSNGQWLYWAPESFIQAEIANSLSNICPFITLEDTVHSILEGASAELKGPKPRNSTSGRVDIIVWWANATPRLLIEVKKAWRDNAIIADAKRLKQLLNRGGSLEGGLLVVYTHAKNPETIDNRFENMADKSGTVLESRIGPKKRVADGDIYHWDAGCFSLDS